MDLGFVYNWSDNQKRRSMRKTLIILLSLLTLSLSGQRFTSSGGKFVSSGGKFMKYSGTNMFYVSNDGNDSNDGNSPSKPWKTIAKVNSSTFSPGDYILFKRGDEWREKLIIGQSGNTQKQITYSAYGSGAKPIINAADLKIGWDDVYNDTNSYLWGTDSPIDGTTYYQRPVVVIDDTLYTQVKTLGSVNSPGKFYVKAGTPDSIFVFCYSDPDLKTVEVSARDYAIYCYQKSHINISHIKVCHGASNGLYMYGQRSTKIYGYHNIDSVDAYRNTGGGIYIINGMINTTINSCHSTYNGNGIVSWDGCDSTVVSYCYTANNIFNWDYSGFYTDGSGIQLEESNGGIVENCETTENRTNLILDASNGAISMIARYNHIHNNTDHAEAAGIGISYSVASGGIISIYYNLIENCGGTGGNGAAAMLSYSTTQSTGQVLVYNNTFYTNSDHLHEIIHISRNQNYIFKNNLFVSEWSSASHLMYFTVAPLAILDYNLYYQYSKTGASNQYYYNTSWYTSFSDWKTAVSQDTNSVYDDPDFVDKTSDWTLQLGSPAINAGTDVGLIRDYSGNSIVGLPDIGCNEYQP